MESTLPCDPPDPPPIGAQAAALKEGGADVRVLFLCFQFHLRLGEFEAAEAFARRRLAAAAPEIDSPHSARAHTNLGLALHFRGDAAAAEAAMTRALEINRRIGNEYGIARDLGNLSLIPESHGDLDRAEALLRESLAIAERIGADDIIATKLTNLGEIALARGKIDATRRLWTRAVAIFERLGPRKHFEEFSRRLAALPPQPTSGSRTP